MKLYEKIKNHKGSAGIIFLIGSVTGALLFILTYGINVLDVTNDGWIFRVSDVDIHQHYIGWCHFRKCPWTFPLGLMDSLSYPYKMSVLWTDSIPLLAIIFKLFRDFLPETFQYLGLYGFFSFSLTGGTAALLIYRLTGDPLSALLTVPFIAESFAMLQRMFYHTSLTAHYLIIIPLLIFLDEPFRWSLKKKCCVWGAYFFLAVMLHPYFWAMGAVIAVFTFFCEFLQNKTVIPALITGAVSAMLTYLGLFITGAFYGDVDTSYSLVGYSSNLNTFINSMGEGRFLPPLPLQNPNQYEGFGYLGLGGLILLLCSVIFYAFYGRKTERSDLRYLIFILCPVFFLMSVLPDITLNSLLLFRIWIPGSLERILGIFRSNGRFIWPAMILLIAASVTVISNSAKKRHIPAVILLLCLSIQLLDMSTLIITNRKEFIPIGRQWNLDLENGALSEKLSGYEHIVVVPDDISITEKVAFFAYKHGLTVNRFYFARNIDEEIGKTLDDYHRQCSAGDPPDNVIFVFDKESMLGWKEDTDLHFYDLTGTIVGLKETLSLPEL
ncbi:MAG: hypothetical protein IJU87_09445 [Lachnospiraceae bacterium]|nr:hypothetical protein [Lachnospiraceae bacterium]